MAGGKLKSRHQVRASTIIEVLISMVIIMVVFGIAMMIYANIVQSSLSVKKIRAQAILNEVLQTDESVPIINATTINVDNIRIEQVVKVYPSESQLSQIDLTAYDNNGKEITALHKVIINKNE